MCRFIAYLGTPLVLSELLLKPINSLVNQSIHARESKTTLNGDGFGLGWYAKEIDEEPALFRSIQPAWNDKNLKYLASKIRSHCLFAHVRAASSGNVSQENCHPFHYKKYLFMHNGDINGFNEIKRALRKGLSDESYNIIQGQTDSEHFFALIVDNLIKANLPFTQKLAAETIIKSIKEIDILKKSHGVKESTLLNIVLTDGDSLVAARYLSSAEEKPYSLYYAIGEKYECVKGVSYIRASERMNKVFLITSERLNNKKIQWNEIPPNHILTVGNDLSPSIIPIS